MGKTSKKSKEINLKSEQQKLFCTKCNPQVYLTFNFTYIDYDNQNYEYKDINEMFERMKYFSKEPYRTLIFKHQGDKKTFIEEIPWDELKWKNSKKPPVKFRDQFPYEPNEKVAIFRVKSEKHPKIRIMGMIKKTIFYIFFLDWDGELYDHGS